MLIFVFHDSVFYNGIFIKESSYKKWAVRDNCKGISIKLYGILTIKLLKGDHKTIFILKYYLGKQ